MTSSKDLGQYFADQVVDEYVKPQTMASFFPLRDKFSFQNPVKRFQMIGRGDDALNWLFQPCCCEVATMLRP